MSMNLGGNGQKVQVNVLDRKLLMLAEHAQFHVNINSVVRTNDHSLSSVSHKTRCRW